MAAASIPSVLPSAALSRPFPTNPLLRRPYFPAGLTSIHKPSLRSSSVARFGFHPGSFSDPNLLERFESVIYTIADAAVANSDVLDSATTTTAKNNDWFSGITYYMESILKVLKDVLSTLHVPYSYGFAIILLTIIVKAATFPLTRKVHAGFGFWDQVESGMAMRSLQPQVKAIQERYAGDQEKIQLETARVYKLAGVNPLAGCLPTLLTIPIWIGLYRAFSNVADEGLLTEGFFWIPSLSGPTTIAARQSGGGISWLFPFVDGHPPLGWSDTFAYLVLPVLLVLSQFVSIEIMQSSQSDDPNVKTSQAVTKFLPLMIGYFSLSVPSGLSLYWFTNNVLSTLQQVWLQKLGGAKNPMKQLNDELIKKVKSEKPSLDLNSMKATAELTTTTKPATKEEKKTPEGLLPGERFKRLKEEEARRREEEKRKAEATVLNGAAKVDEKKPSTVVNGGLASQEPTKDEEQVSPNGNVNNRKEEQQSDEEKNQKEVIES
ncbi:ALBINO3-like protein 1, chloroplastic [Linum perenne]